MIGVPEGTAFLTQKALLSQIRLNDTFGGFVHRKGECRGLDASFYMQGRSQDLEGGLRKLWRAIKSPEYRKIDLDEALTSLEVR